jgi:prepilin-type N-terminal cleavage/methylation domain-containing protein
MNKSINVMKIYKKILSCVIIPRRVSGFTLAEVLITLAIIGVIASLTIPAMIQNIQDAQFKIAWKKAYSDISHAAYLYTANNGGTFKGTGSFYQKINPYLEIIKTCSATVGDCFPWHTYYLDGSIYLTSTNYDTAILNNGVSLLVGEESTDCTANYGSHVPSCVHLFVDINGTKGPNTIGKDVNSLMILDDGTVKPSGDSFLNIWNATPGDCFQPGSTGMSCAAQYLYQ